VVWGHFPSTVLSPGSHQDIPTTSRNCAREAQNIFTLMIENMNTWQIYWSTFCDSNNVWLE